MLLSSRVGRPSLAAAAMGLLVLSGACSAGTSVDENPPLSDDATHVVVETSLGNFTVGLYDEMAPVTVENFLKYVDAGFFSGTAFHRILPGFVIQGGGYVHTSGMEYRSKERMAPIALESDNGLKNLRGTLTMARGGMPASATSEFFVNLIDNQRLDRFGDVELGYAVFGRVVEGMEVVDAIAAVETGVSPTVSLPGEVAVPVEPVIIRSVRRR